MSTGSHIELSNVRVNNLKNVSLSIEHGQWLSICGLSGSGKSSLAFDTLFAEGQRRYLESLSVKNRQFVQQMDRPDADRISGVPPSIAIRAVRGKAGPRTTLASSAEIEPLLRLLFANLSKGFCPGCNAGIQSHSPQSVAQWCNELDDGLRSVVTWQLPDDTDAQRAIQDAQRDGFVRAIVGGKFLELSDVCDSLSADPIFVVADRVKTGSVDLARLTESLESAFYCGRGVVSVFVQDQQGQHRIDDQPYIRFPFSTRTLCVDCDVELPDREPGLFSNNNAASACSNCSGVGYLKGTLERCHRCAGSRFEQLPLAYRLSGLNFAEVCELTVDDAVKFVDLLEVPNWQRTAVSHSMSELRRRLQFLQQAGLGYLTLGRPVRTLSSGEAQRVHLTRALGTSLVNLLFVFDEPSIGLHPHNVTSLVSSIEDLHFRGNTVVTVDHCLDVVSASERIVEIGPGAGSEGGTVTFDGTPSEMAEADDSRTGQYLAGKTGQSSGNDNRRKSHRFMKLIGASGNNLKTINVEFPLGVLCVVSGVSGAGKSSLVQQTLYGAVSGQHQQDVAGTLPFEEIYGADWVSEVVLVDDSPIGKSSRSNPVTYVKAFSEIRNCFADTREATRQNLGPGKFSFNVAGGRCEKCRGDGQLLLNMQFMADLYVTCDQCQGTRYREDVLSVRYRDRNISQVLQMTVRDAFSFFRGHPAVQSKLKALIDVGLDYIQLGQPANTLSSGESQRLKMAHYLNAAKNRRVLFLMDQPTSGLHPDDIVRLLDCFDSLISVGHSMIVVEHQLQFLKHADWIIDLGPGAADEGGFVVAQGTPEQIVANADSVTGRYLKPLL